MATIYVPVLRWKRGEVRALENLKPATQRKIIPLIDLMPHEYDPAEEGGSDPALEQRLLSDARNLKRARDSEITWADLSDQNPDALANGVHLVDFFFDAANAEGCEAVPVVRLGADDDYVNAVRTVANRDGRGAVIRIIVPEFEDGEYSNALSEITSEVELSPADVDLVVDMRAGVVPTPAQSRIARAILDDIPNIGAWRSVVLASGAFPRDLSAMSIGHNLVPRNDFHLWRHVCNHNPAREPIFADNTTRYPELADDFDPALVNASASVRYTIEDDWLVLRGRGVRTPGAGGFQQYRGHSQHLIGMPEYSGANFSWGDQRIQEIANGTTNSGNSETWVSISVNHHIEFAVEQISNLDET